MQCRTSSNCTNSHPNSSFPKRKKKGMLCVHESIIPIQPNCQIQLLFINIYMLDGHIAYILHLLCSEAFPFCGKADCSGGSHQCYSTCVPDCSGEAGERIPNSHLLSTPVLLNDRNPWRTSALFKNSCYNQRLFNITQCNLRVKKLLVFKFCLPVFSVSPPSNCNKASFFKKAGLVPCCKRLVNQGLNILLRSLPITSKAKIKIQLGINVPKLLSVAEMKRLGRKLY